jgi:ribulose-bisphosphate carboxylase large chain
MNRRFYSSCELPVRRESPRGELKNRLFRFKKDYRWTGIKIEKYKNKGDDFEGIIRQVLVGNRGENLRFHLRYFEIAPGGYSSYELHKHEHVVVCIRGRGRVRLGERRIDMNFLDTLYIAPGTPHRLYNPYNEPFGFFCIVNAKRDRPKKVKINLRSR